MIMLLLFAAVLALVIVNVPIAVALGVVAIVAMVATLGSSLNSAPPPPFTWQSMNPGASRSPSRSMTLSAPKVSRALSSASMRPSRTSRVLPLSTPASVSNLPLRKACSIRRSRSPC